MAPSKVRYYDRQGLIRGERSGNNYRNFTSSDALDIYHAQMLRSFDMTIQETLEAQKRDLGQIDGWLEGGSTPVGRNETDQTSGDAGVFPIN